MNSVQWFYDNGYTRVKGSSSLEYQVKAERGVLTVWVLDRDRERVTDYFKYNIKEASA